MQTASHDASTRRLSSPFERLFAEELPFVWATLQRLGVRPGDVEDVAHDVFMLVYRKFDQYDPARPARPWLFAFAMHGASDYRRRARHRVEVMGAEHDAPSDLPGADSQVSAAEEAQLVEHALESIEVERRAVFIAFELDELPMKDIAEALEIPLNTAYSRLRLAREEFAAAIRRAHAQATRGVS